MLEMELDVDSCDGERGEEEDEGPLDGRVNDAGNRPLSERNGKKQDPKVCGVCGDKALGNNFNAITCESCKAFFRRNALRPKQFVCPFSDSCKVDPVTRRFCQKCRLKKCFDIGMKKEWIMTDEEKKMKKQKIEQNRMKRSTGGGSGPSGATVDDDSSNGSGGGSGGPPAPKIPAVVGVGDVPIHSSSRLSAPANDATSFDSSSHFIDQSRIPTVINHHSGNPNASHTGSSQPDISCLAEGSMHPVSHMRTYGWNENAENAIYGNNIGNNESKDSSPISSPGGTQSHPPGALDYPPVSGLGNNDSNNRVEEEESMPLLASLMRPGVAESPPDVLAHDSTSGSSYPESPEVEGGLGTPVSSHHHLHQMQSHQVHPQATQYPHECHEPSSPIPSLLETRGRLYGEEEDERDGHDIPPLPLNTMDSILSVAISAEFNAFGVLGNIPGGGRSSHSHHNYNGNSKELNKAEKAKLNELFYASEALNAPVDQDGPVKVETCDPSLINVINLTDIAIRRLIKMSKKIRAFKDMCQEDQIALLKGGCTEMMILRSVVSYDPERDSWNIPHSNGYNIKLGVLKEARGNLYEEHQRFVKSFKAEWREDDNIMIILCAITLFTPERPNVIHRDVVKLEQDSYYYLLKRYLESTRNGCEARSTYLQLIKKIAELHVLNSNHLRVFLEVNPKEVEPLLIEIFDLKQ